MKPLRRLVIVLLLGAALHVSAAPTVSNISAVQRPNTMLVDVTYDVTAPGVSNVKISLEISGDGGATFTVPAVTVTGDVGVNVAVGNGKQLTWDAGFDWSNQHNSQVRFRVTADDLIIANFARIESGAFSMGDSLDGLTDATPVHTVNVSAVYLFETEVSKAQWDQVRAWALSNGYADLSAAASSSSDSPAKSISWYDAVKWCNARSEMEALTPCYYTDVAQSMVYKIGQAGVTNAMVKWDANGYRLPTEAEWEKAARGGFSGRRFPWGNTITHNEASYYSDVIYGSYDISSTRGIHPSFPTPIGFFPANAFGLREMSGSVWEWCWDWYDASFYGSSPANNPTGPATGAFRTRRGGAYQSYAHRTRSAHRDMDPPTLIHPTQGFRTARGGSQLTGATAAATTANGAVTTMPKIAVEQPFGTDLVAGSASTDFGVVPLGGTPSIVTYTIRNIGANSLLNLAVTKSGTNNGDFVLGPLAATPVEPGDNRTFTVTFAPAGGATGPRSTVLHIASNDVNQNPFDITLNGQAFSTALDTDSDGMNDWGEYTLASLGFDWLVSQPGMVTTYFAGANANGLYTQAQFQALNIGAPLLGKNPTTGEFTLTIGVERSLDLGTFDPFPMTAPQTLINAQGKLEFRFTVPEDAAFFQLRAE